MIDTDLFHSNYIGRDGFKWWIGQVADPETSGWGSAREAKNSKVITDENDEVYTHRCKVRVLGYHTISDEEGYVLRDSDLPWAHIMVPAGTGTGVNGIGQLPEYQGGENVLGFFLDGDDAQQPVIIGGFARGHQVEEVEDTATNDADSQIDCLVRPFKPRLPSNTGMSNSHIIKVAGNSNPGGAGTPVGTGQTTSSSNSSASRGSVATGDKQETKNGASQGMEKDVNISRPACEAEGNIIAEVQQAVLAAIQTLTAFQEYKGLYIDGTIGQVRTLASSIGGQVKIIAGLIRKLLEVIKGDLLKTLEETFGEAIQYVPETFKSIFGISLKTAIDVVVCVFEEIGAAGIFEPILAIIEAAVTGQIVDAILCAIEQIIADILNEFLQPIFDGISGLLNQLADIFGGISAQLGAAISQGLALLGRVLSFIKCAPAEFQCPHPAAWALSGPSQEQRKEFNDILKQINIPNIELRDLGIDDADAIALRCESDIGYLFPPNIVFSSGDGEAQAVVADGQVIGIYIVEPGKGYSPLTPPTLKIEQTGAHGTGAGAKAVVQVDPETGGLTNPCLVNPGSGYVSSPEVAVTSIADITPEEAALLPLPQITDSTELIPYLKHFHVQNTGVNYSDDDTVLINNQPAEDYGLTIELDIAPGGYITDINITNNTNNGPLVFNELPDVRVQTTTGANAFIVACLGFLQVETQTEDSNGNIQVETTDGQQLTVNADDILTSVNCFLQ
jgi:hypothetical protein